MKKLIVLFLGTMMLSGCSWMNGNDKVEATPSTTPTPTMDSDKQEASDVVGETGTFGTPLVSVQLTDGKISWLSIDELSGDTTKKAMGDEYKLPDTAIASWKDQIKNLEEYIVKNGVESIKTDEEGKAVNEDLLSQCTIQIENYLKTIDKAVMDAKEK